MKKRSKAIVIVGPTASGKTALAIQLAKMFNGEVISADSRQVYRGLNIGTGKVTNKEMSGVPHHMIDIADPKKRITVSDYQKQARGRMEDIFNRGKLPIICGGTGFYISALVDNIEFPEVLPNLKLRNRLEKASTASLLEQLKKIAPERATLVDPNNKRRLIRAIEIATQLGYVPSVKVKPDPNIEYLWIGIKQNKEHLQQNIHDRLMKRLKRGMLKEAQKLHAAGLTYKRMLELGLEYRFEAQYLQGRITKDEMIERLEFAIRHYAKRQMTWFKKDRRIHWLDNTSSGFDASLKRLTEKFTNFK
jgi:tRNA dimethylallyltransferase